MPKCERCGADMSVGHKCDAGKDRLDLLDAYALSELSKVLAFGATKYAENNWRCGLKWSKVIAACLRHMFAIMRGEDRDPETGLLHSAHAMCNMMFLTNFYRSHPELDDRSKDQIG